ncbi:MAG: HNH endonuclease [Planctomycetes bacterium]|nr:HNH endonuclease [Planctomycetota bacterium]
MSTKPIDRLMFAQGGLCFFCQDPLPPSEATVEHLVATANGGTNDFDNCVACCKTLNSLLGHMSLKEKLRVVLNQKGDFKCPKSAQAAAPKTTGSNGVVDRFELVIADLRKRAATRPRTTKTLKSSIKSLFKKQLTEHELESLLGKLKSEGIVNVTGAKVTYEIPAVK